MEEKGKQSTAEIEVPVTPEKKMERTSIGSFKKNSGGTNMSRMKNFLLRRRSAEKSKSVEDGDSSSKWKKALRSVRSLPRSEKSASPRNEISDDVFSPPMSPDPETFKSIDAMRKFASAGNLQELDQSEERDQLGELNRISEESIDTKAEEFISRFYKQMRLQG